MSWHFSLPITFLSLIILIYYLSKKRETFQKLKNVIPQLSLLFFLSLTIAILKIDFIVKIIHIEELDFLLWLLILFFTLVIIVKISSFLVFDFFFSIQRGTHNVRLFRDIFIIILYIIGMLLIANYFLNIKITVILASSAVLTVVVGLALQDLLGDLFSGIALSFEELLKIGDWVKIGEYQGQIEQLRWRAIILRTIDNALVLIPNQLASEEKVVNYGDMRRNIALRLEIGVSYRNSPDFVIAALHRVLDSVDQVLRSPKPVVMVKSFEDFSINYDIRFWLSDYSQKDIIKSDIRRKAWYEFKRHGIQIPFPIRDVYIKKEKEVSLSRQEIIALLEHNELLSTLGSDVLANLAEEVEIVPYGIGEVLIREDEINSFFYLLLEGEVEILKGKKILGRLGKNDYFGEMSVFTGEKTSASVRVSQESKILKIPPGIFKEAVTINEHTAKKLSAVIAGRKVELSEWEKNRPVTSQILQKDSENILIRIKKYFGI